MAWLDVVWGTGDRGPRYLLKVFFYLSSLPYNNFHRISPYLWSHNTLFICLWRSYFIVHLHWRYFIYLSLFPVASRVKDCAFFFTLTPSFLVYIVQQNFCTVYGQTDRATEQETPDGVGF